MTRRRNQERQRSCFWALHPEVADRALSRLSPTAYRGFQWAARIALNQQERRELFPRYDDMPRLAIEEIAADEGLWTFTVRMAIAQARKQLFGSLSDSGIRARIRRAKTTEMVYVQCQEPGCTSPPRRKGGRKRGPHPRYCARHFTGAARVRRYRAQAAATN